MDDDTINALGSLAVADDVLFEVILDVGFAWPTERRPRRERIGAVAKQIANMMETAQGHAIESFASLEYLQQFRVLICGKDVVELSERLRVCGVAFAEGVTAAANSGVGSARPLASLSVQQRDIADVFSDAMLCAPRPPPQVSTAPRTHPAQVGRPSPQADAPAQAVGMECKAAAVVGSESRSGSGVGVEKGAEVREEQGPGASASGLTNLLGAARVESTAASASSNHPSLPSPVQQAAAQVRIDFVYLSPDADVELDGSSLWPSGPRPVCFVVGGLVDRRIKRGRSLGRAQQFKVSAARLPLASAGLVGASDEPLNIDTVMEALLLWKTASVNLHTALQQALRLHARRHPRRITHSGTFGDVKSDVGGGAAAK